MALKSGGVLKKSLNKFSFHFLKLYFYMKVKGKKIDEKTKPRVKVPHIGPRPRKVGVIVKGGTRTKVRRKNS